MTEQAKEKFRGRYVTVSFDGAENNVLWFTDPATEEATRIMVDEMPEFVESLKYWMPGLFAPIWDEGFDEASDDLGRSQLMADMGEDLNPYRSKK